MNKVFTTLLLLTVFTVQAQTPQTFTLLIKDSYIGWKVDYAIGTKGHEGKFKLISGTVLVKNGIIESGSFVIDINSIQVTDIQSAEGRKDLEDHLKNDDFFSTNTYPTGSFTVLNTTKPANNEASVTGNLVLKGISNTIRFPIGIIQQAKQLKIKSTFAINRTSWGINYQSGSIFGEMKDGIISDQVLITLDFTLQAE
jgi:polyisoprenoid-binding protein YceI